MLKYTLSITSPLHTFSGGLGSVSLGKRYTNKRKSTKKVAITKHIRPFFSLIFNGYLATPILPPQFMSDYQLVIK